MLLNGITAIPRLLGVVSGFVNDRSAKEQYVSRSSCCVLLLSINQSATKTKDICASNKNSPHELVVKT